MIRGGFEMDVLQILAAILNPVILLLILLGVALGIVFGAIPGLNAPIAISLVLPFTLYMDVTRSIALIIGIYIGGISGGLISAILLRIPGAASSVTTVLDGYPMTQKGRAADALSICTFVSFLGGLFSMVALLFLGPYLSDLALSFGPLEYLGTVVLALSLICVLMDGNVLRGFLSVFIGLILASVGISPIDGTQNRFTFGNVQLSSGFNVIALMLGLYAMTEVLSLSSQVDVDITVVPYKKRRFYLPERHLLKGQTGNILRSSVIGTFIGMLPGMGPSVAGIVSYAQAKKMSKHPEEFGTGCVAGVVASETANNAVTGGALIPMLSLAIPGDICTSVILSALMMQGITCGPLMVIESPEIFYIIVLIALIANVFMLLLQSGTIPITAKIIQIPRYLLLPLIAMFCSTGVLAINNRIFDLQTLLVFSLLGYILEKNKYPLMPLVLAFVLGPMFEQYYRSSLLYYDNIAGMFTEITPGLILLLLGFLCILYGILSEIPYTRKKISGIMKKTLRN